MKTLQSHAVPLALLVLTVSFDAAAEPRTAWGLPFSNMDPVAIEPAPSEHRSSCIYPRDVELPRMTVIWRQGQSERWAVTYAARSPTASPYSVRSSRVYCDGHVEFLWEEFDFAECEHWHAQLSSLAPTANHRLFHIYRGEDEAVDGLFCATPADCMLIETSVRNGKLEEMYAYQFDYTWE